jgi:hypothetical protein
VALNSVAGIFLGYLPKRPEKLHHHSWIEAFTQTGSREIFAR